ncbi:hypothetical protein EBR77_03465 [bacterium]|nr:hypothetical protein [bacterium]
MIKLYHELSFYRFITRAHTKKYVLKNKTFILQRKLLFFILIEQYLYQNIFRQEKSGDQKTTAL